MEGGLEGSVVRDGGSVIELDEKHCKQSEVGLEHELGSPPIEDWYTKSDTCSRSILPICSLTSARRDRLAKTCLANSFRWNIFPSGVPQLTPSLS